MRYYGNENDTFVITETGKIYLVSSVDHLEGPEVVDELPPDVEELSAAACYDLCLEGIEPVTVQDKLEKIRAHYGSYTKFNETWGIHRRTREKWSKAGHKHSAAAVALVDAVLKIIELEDTLKLARYLLESVIVTESGEMFCEDVTGRNWFDLRNELLNLKK